MKAAPLLLHRLTLNAAATTDNVVLLTLGTQICRAPISRSVACKSSFAIAVGGTTTAHRQAAPCCSDGKSTDLYMYITIDIVTHPRYQCEKGTRIDLNKTKGTFMAEPQIWIFLRRATARPPIIIPNQSVSASAQTVLSSSL